MSWDVNSVAKPWLLSEKLVRPDWVTNNPRPDAALWIDKNENLDPELLKFTNGLLHSLDDRAIASYPDSGPVYRQLAELEGIDPLCLRLTPGSDGGIRLLFDALVNPGDKVLHTSPTFAMYPVYCQMFGAHAVKVEYEASRQGPVLPLQRLLHAITTERAKLVCLPNPDSPTGTVFTLEDLSSLAKACIEVGSTLLIDEAYYPISSVTAKTLLSKFPNMVIARTFAKAWGLAGLRVGYTMASRELTNIFHKLRPMYEVNTVAIFVLREMIANYNQVEASVERLQRGRKYFIDEMRKLGFSVSEAHGNFVHVKFGDRELIVHSALNGRVLYRKSFAEPCLAGYSRFSLTTREIFESVVQMIKSGLS